MTNTDVDLSVEREWEVVADCVEHGDGLRVALGALQDYLKDVLASSEDGPVPTLEGLTRQRKAREALAALERAHDMLEASDVHLEAALGAMGYAR